MFEGRSEKVWGGGNVFITDEGLLERMFSLIYFISFIHLSVTDQGVGP